MMPLLVECGDTLVCRECNKSKPITEFRTIQKRRYVSPQCRDCRQLERRPRKNEQRKWKMQHDPVFKNRRKNESTRRRIRKYGGLVSKDIVDYEKVWDRDEGLCYICGLEVDRSDCHFDHVIPLCERGSHSEDNLAVTHSWCNLRKSRKLLEDME